MPRRFLAVASLIAPLACGNPETGGRRVSLDLVVRRAGAGEAIVNEAGYTIDLERAAVSVGPIYFYEGAPIASARPSWLRWFLIPEAHAHPGHYMEGDALGEALSPWSADVLSGPARVASGAGVTGVARSASLEFHAPPEGSAAAVLGQDVVLVEGTARRDGEVIAFRLAASAGDLVADADAVILGCPFAGGEIDGDGTVTLALDLALWLDQVDFADVAPAASAMTEVPRGSRAHEAFTRGLKKAAGYAFSFEARQERR